MDPISSRITAPALLKPGHALSNDLSAILREGRVMAGEVLQTLDGSSVMIGVGRHRVPADTQVELEVGRRFLFQVERHGSETMLRMLGGAEPVEPELLAMLRWAVARERPLGEVLGRVLRELARLSRSGDGAASKAPSGSSAAPAGEAPVGTKGTPSSGTPVGAAATPGTPAGAVPAGGGAPLTPESLLAAAGAAGGTAGGPSPAEAARALAPHAMSGAIDGMTLQELVRRSGLELEHRLLLVAFRKDPEGVARAAARDVVREWLDGAAARARAVTGASPAESQGLFERLAQWIEGELDVGAALRGPVDQRLDALLRSILAELERTPGEQLARQMARELRARGASSLPEQSPVVRALDKVARWAEALAQGGALEAGAAKGAGLGRAGVAGSLIEALRGDLKTLLLQWFDELPEGRARETVGHAARALEAEQVLQLARRDLSEWQHLALPMACEPWTTAHVYHRQEHESAQAGEELHRVVIGVEFGHLGPVRVDILSKKDQLTVRLSATRDDVIDAIRERADELAEGLSAAGHHARLAFARVEPHECRVDGMSHDIEFLREHHLMDVNG